MGIIKFSFPIDKNEKVITIENFFADIANTNDCVVGIDICWKASYEITERQKKNASILSCHLNINGATHTEYKSNEKHTFKVGDISNDFFKVISFKGYSVSNPENLISFIDIPNLNRFIIKYGFPPFYYEDDSHTVEQQLLFENGKIQRFKRKKTRKELIYHYPMNEDIQDYLKSILQFNGNHFISKEFVTSVCRAEVLCSKLNDDITFTATSAAMNDIIAYDMMYAAKHHSFKKCNCCGTYFFANRGNNQSYCIDCKNATKKNLLSQNTARNSFIRKLNRMGNITVEEKNKLLIEEGFEPLKK